MLVPVQHVDVLAHFNIAVTIDALVAVGTGVIHTFTFVTTFQRETHDQPSQCKPQRRSKG
jgi:hypothetical protein